METFLQTLAAATAKHRPSLAAKLRRSLKALGYPGRAMQADVVDILWCLFHFRGKFRPSKEALSRLVQQLMPQPRSHEVQVDVLLNRALEGTVPRVLARLSKRQLTIPTNVALVVAMQSSRRSIWHTKTRDWVRQTFGVWPKNIDLSILSRSSSSATQQR